MKIINLIRASLDTFVSPMVYIMAGVSVIIGFCYAFLPGLPDIQNSLLYKHEVYTGFSVWGVVLMVSAIACIVGMASKYRWLLEPGAFFAFLMWVFASITYFTNGFYFAFLTYSLFHMLFYGYVYLSSSLGLIRRIAISKLEE